MGTGYAKPITKGMKFFPGHRYMINKNDGYVAAWSPNLDADPDFLPYNPFTQEAVAEQEVSDEKLVELVRERYGVDLSKKLQMKQADQAETEAEASEPVEEETGEEETEEPSAEEEGAPEEETEESESVETDLPPRKSIITMKKTDMQELLLNNGVSVPRDAKRNDLLGLVSKLYES